MNLVYLRRKSKLLVEVPPSTAETRSTAEIATLQKKLERSGYCLTEELAERVKKLSRADFLSFYNHLDSWVCALTGNDRAFQAMYPGFPSEVMEKTEAELYLNALYHYVSLELPAGERTKRPKLIEQPDLQVISSGTRQERDEIFTNLCAAKSSLSPSDREDMERFVKSLSNDVVSLLPDEIPMRETVAALSVLLLRHTDQGNAFIEKHARAANDFLRIAVAWCNGDVSLFEPCRFEKIPRAIRKMILAGIDRSNRPVEDMLKWGERWVRLGERLHPGEFSDRFPRAHEAFQVIREGIPYQTENGLIESLLEERDIPGVLQVLAEKPGVFGRRLDHLLRISENPSAVIDAFRKVAPNVPTPILLRMMTHFRFRERQRNIEATDDDVIRWKKPGAKKPADAGTEAGLVETLKSMINVKRLDAPPPSNVELIKIPNELIRVFFPKGEVAKIWARPEALPELPPGVAEQAAEACREALLRSFSSKSPLGTCWIDPELKHYRIPTAQRSASKSLRSLSRGSRLPIPDASTLRFFIWWKNGDYRTDLDLSAVFFDARFRYLDVVSYYNLKNFGGYHSGDIVDAPEGAAEFIDLNLAKTKSKDVRYVVMVVTSFTQQPYCDLPECFAGWMARKSPNSGEIFEARTVVDKVDLTADTRIALPAIFDLETMNVIWSDLALKNSPSFNNVENNLSGLSLMVRSMMALKTPSLHDLFSLHCEARGVRVDDRDEADQIFSIDEGVVTPFDQEKIAAEYF